jgi:hypothetical protein
MNTYRKERLIDIARSLQDLRTGRSLHFSFILKSNKLLITSVNSYDKLHPYHKFGKYNAIRASNPESYIAGQHSEVAAIRSFINRFRHSDFTGLTMFNVRLSRNGEPMLSMPCKNCETLLNTFNFKSIEHT